jgi:hypothetical protein
MNKGILMGVLITAITGCASVDFNNSDGVDEGFLYYQPQPFLLIEKKDKNIISRIISIPNTEKPRWIKQGEGWGSAEMSFEIDNGMVKSFNSKSDNKGAETLASIAGLATAKSALDAVDAGIKVAEISAAKMNAVNIVGIPTPTPGKYYELGLFKLSSAKLKSEVLAPLQMRSNEFKDEIAIIEKSIARLDANIYMEYKENDLDKFIDDVEKKREKSKSISDQLKIVQSTLGFYVNNKVEKAELIAVSSKAIKPLDGVTQKLSTFSERSSSITGLYEIEFIDGNLKLTKVVINY